MMLFDSRIQLWLHIVYFRDRHEPRPACSWPDLDTVVRGACCDSVHWYFDTGLLNYTSLYTCSGYTGSCNLLMFGNVNVLHTNEGRRTFCYRFEALQRWTAGVDNCIPIAVPILDCHVARQLLVMYKHTVQSNIHTWINSFSCVELKNVRMSALRFTKHVLSLHNATVSRVVSYNDL